MAWLQVGRKERCRARVLLRLRRGRARLRVVSRSPASFSSWPSGVGIRSRRRHFLFELEREAERAARSEAEKPCGKARHALTKPRWTTAARKGCATSAYISPEDYDAAQQDLLDALSMPRRPGSAASSRPTGGSHQKQQSAPVVRACLRYLFSAGRVGSAGTPSCRCSPPEYMKVRFSLPGASSGMCRLAPLWKSDLMALTTPLSGKVSFVSPQAEYTLPIIYSRENRGKLVFLVEGSLAPEHARLPPSWRARRGAAEKGQRGRTTWRSRQNELFAHRYPTGTRMDELAIDVQGITKASTGVLWSTDSRCRCGAVKSTAFLDRMAAGRRPSCEFSAGFSKPRLRKRDMPQSRRDYGERAPSSVASAT